MRAALRRLIRRLLGRHRDQPQREKQQHARPAPGGRDLAGRPQEKPATDWLDRVERKDGGGDWLRERLRSLPDEQAGRGPKDKGRRR
jgi:hypothetical protein